MNLIDQIVTDVGNVDTCKQIRPFDIKSLGYKFSKNRIPIKESEYILCELIDEDTKKSVDFCFLLAKKTTMGIILAYPYERYYAIAVKEDRALKRFKKIKRQD